MYKCTMKYKLWTSISLLKYRLWNMFPIISRSAKCQTRKHSIFRELLRSYFIRFISCSFAEVFFIIQYSPQLEMTVTSISLHLFLFMSQICNTWFDQYIARLANIFSLIDLSRDSNICSIKCTCSLQTFTWNNTFPILRCVPTDSILPFTFLILH